MTRGPFGKYAEGASVCGAKSYVIYDGVLKYDLDKLPFNIGFRTLEYVRGLIGKVKKIDCRRVIISICFSKIL